jgi:hypothetical protein
MSETPTFTTDMEAAFVALRSDLLADGGPRISTMRNYRFAILPYRPSDEFKMRDRLRRLVGELRASGWGVLSVSLQRLMLARIRSHGDAVVQSIIRREKALHDKDPGRALEHLKQFVAPLILEADGVPADVTKLIDDFAVQYPDRADSTVIFIEHAAALYPFHKSSALLKHLDGHTHNIPVILLYPGERHGATGLSFMGQNEPDRDYRPRIYP